MERKKIKKKKVGKIVLIGMSFLLTVLLTFSITLAWFYDADWASNYINMAGSVGIEIQRQQRYDENGDPIYSLEELTTSGSGKLHFTITTDKAYPGQAIDVSASVYNNGGKSGSGGSPCYIRAHFAVYTNIAAGYKEIVNIKRSDYAAGSTGDAAYYAALNAVIGLDSAAFTDLVDYYAALDKERDSIINEKNMGADALYQFFNTLIDKQNTDTANTTYYWRYYQNTGSKPLSSSGISDSDVLHYFEGQSSASETTAKDKGYFYLCSKTDKETLLPLNYGDTAVFLWNNTFIIPWNLTNLSADKYLFVGVTFQAIQTFIPNIDADGIISDEADNQLPANQCKYNNHSVQTVFNSCAFTPIDTRITVDNKNTPDIGDDVVIDFATEPGFDITSTPDADKINPDLNPST